MNESWEFHQGFCYFTNSLLFVDVLSSRLGWLDDQRPRAIERPVPELVVQLPETYIALFLFCQLPICKVTEQSINQYICWLHRIFLVVTYIYIFVLLLELNKIFFVSLISCRFLGCTLAHREPNRIWSLTLFVMFTLLQYLEAQNQYTK